MIKKTGEVYLISSITSFLLLNYLDRNIDQVWYGQYGLGRFITIVFEEIFQIATLAQENILKMAESTAT